MAGKIGRFSILRELGQGGFGKVYLGSDPQLADRYVAIKVMNATTDANLRIRFRNEAVAAASLKHPNIVTILEYGEYEGQPYIAMEYLEGDDLGQRLKYGPPLTLFQKVAILEQTASALYAAHSHANTIIHRDIKPANVMLLKDGTVKIMDFGIARLAGADSTRLTSTNVMIGSVLYMAPEQFMHGITDVLTDIWSFGVLAYEVLAEIHPYHGGDVAQVMYRVTSVDPRPIIEFVQGCPEELSTIVCKLMSRKREDRYQSLEDAGFDIRGIVTDLRHSEAGLKLQNAEAHYAAGRFEPAMQAVREALDIDSNLRSARVLREKLNKQIQGHAQRSKVEELVQQAADCEARGDWDGAIAQIQSAMKLDPANASLTAREEDLNRAKGKDRQLAQWTTLAQQALDSNNLELAEQYASAAEQIDRSARAAVQLRAKLDAAYRRQQEDLERQKQAEAKRAAEREAQRQAELALQKAAAVGDAVRAARAQVAAGKLDEALRGLLASAEGLGESPEFAKVLDEVKRGIEARNKAAEVARKLQTIRAIAAGGDFARAKEACIVALRHHPNDPQILELQKSVDRELAARATEQAIQTELESGRLAEALALAEKARQEFPENARLLALVAEIHELRRRELLRKLIADALAHASNQRWNAAAELLRDAQALDANDPELVATLADFERHSREDLEQRIAQTRAMMERGEYSPASVAVEAIRQRFPESPEIAALTAEVNAKLSQRIRSLSGMQTTLPSAAKKAPVAQKKSNLWLAVIPGVLVAAGAGWYFLRPQPAGTLTASPDKIEFSYQQGALAPAAQKISITGGAAKLSIRPPSWLTVTQQPASASVTTLTVKLKPESLPPGEHSGEVVIESDGARALAIPARLKVDRAPAGALIVEPRELLLAPDHNSATISISSSGERQNIQVIGAAPWLTVEPAAGRTPLTIQVHARQGLVKSGSLSCTLTVLSTGDASKAKSVNVMFTIPEAVKPLELKKEEKKAEEKKPEEKKIEEKKEEKKPEEKKAEEKKEEKKIVEPEKPKAVQITTPWNGALSGKLIWRGTLAPGATVDLTQDTPLEGRKFPWLYDTRVTVTADAPAAVEVQPSKANTWNLIRIRNTGTQPLPLVTLNWRIAQ